MNQGLALCLAGLCLTQVSSVSRAAEADYCAQYAKLAVQQSDALSIMSCFRGFDDRWHLDYRRHYDWCLRVPESAADAQRNYRRTRLAQCQGSG